MRRKSKAPTFSPLRGPDYGLVLGQFPSLQCFSFRKHFPSSPQTLETESLQVPWRLHCLGGGSRIWWTEIRARRWGVGMGSAGGPEAGSGDPRTYLDPRPPGPGPGGQACHRTLCFLKEGVLSLWEWRGHGCPRADSPCRWMCATTQCVQHPLAGFPPLPLAACVLRWSSGCSQFRCPADRFPPPLRKCPVIWSPFSAGW